MAQICPACKTSNPDAATVCANCGAPLAAATTTDGTSPETSTIFRPPGSGVPAVARRGASSGAVAEAARRRAAQARAAEVAASTPTARAGVPAREGRAGVRPGTRGPARGLSAPLNDALDRAGLPRFTTQRYLAIWAGFAVILLLTLGGLVWLGASNARQSAANAAPTPLAGQVLTGTIVTITTTKGTFQVTLDTDPAVKETVRNFRAKVTSGYYNGKLFHRVESWLAQGGAPNCTPTNTHGCNAGGGTIKGEYTNKPFAAGSVGMAAASPHAAQVNDSQWFVVKTAAPSLVNEYPHFGEVTEGLDVVQKLVGCKAKAGSPGEEDCTGADMMQTVTLGAK